MGSVTAPYYSISNAFPHLNYGRAEEAPRHAYKFNVTLEMPLFKAEKGFVGHALGGWSLGSFLQFYTGHPVDVVDGRTRFRARGAGNALILDANGIPINLGGDYNLDGVANDHPMFVGSSLSGVYSGKNPADGIFIDNNIIGCGAPWVPATVTDIAACNSR